MCESCNGFAGPGAVGFSRRVLLAGAVIGAVGTAGAVLAEPTLARPALRLQLPTVAVTPGLEIVTRDGWATNRPPRGEIQVEADVRFLLVHHTAEPGNDYGPGDAPALLRGMYDYHTSSAKGWPDIAYNFLIDQFGIVYEGRSGSLAQASVPDATGGSQGFSQLACFIGNLDVQAPTDAAVDSMDRVLAYLADRHRVDITPGAMTTFISRGSNRHPRGSAVHTKTVAGHRDMSTTTCPGDFAYAMVEDDSFAARASALQVAGMTTTTTPPTTTMPPDPTPSTPSATTAPLTSEPSTVPATQSTVSGARSTYTEHEPPTVAGEENGGGSLLPYLALGGGAVLGVSAGVHLLRRSSLEREPDDDSSGRGRWQ